MTEGHAKQDLHIKRWELNGLAIEGILAGALILAAIFGGAPRLLERYLTLPQPVWVGLGMFVLFWAIYPGLNVYSRNDQGREISAGRALLVSSLVGVVAALLFAVLR